jgi:hypothetical protein
MPDASGSSGEKCGGSPVLHGTPVVSFRTRQVTVSGKCPWMSCRLVKRPIVVRRGSIGGSSGPILALEDGYPNAVVARRLLHVRHGWPGSSTENLLPKGYFYQEPVGSDSVPHIRFSNSPARWTHGVWTLCGTVAHVFSLGISLGGFVRWLIS